MKKYMIMAAFCVMHMLPVLGASSNQMLKEIKNNQKEIDKLFGGVKTVYGIPTSEVRSSSSLSKNGKEKQEEKKPFDDAKKINDQVGTSDPLVLSTTNISSSSSFAGYGSIVVSMFVERLIQFF